MRPEPHESARRLQIFAINPPRDELYERINERTETHFAAGLVEEVRDLLAQGVPPIQMLSAPMVTGEWWNTSKENAIWPALSSRQNWMFVTMRNGS